jgi:pyridoxine 5-phosphate synthase
MEMAATEEMVRIATELRPDQVTLVSERASEITTEGGLDVLGTMETVAAAIRALSAKDIQMSIFIDPDPAQVEAAVKLGAAMIELNTIAFSEACPKSPDLAGPAVDRELNRIVQASGQGKKQGLKILAGHGLTYRNVHLISGIPEIEELNIGHNIIARASLVGMDRAVREMYKQ